MEKALFTAHLEHSADLGDFEILATLAGSVGLQAEEALHILASGTFENEVRAEQSAWIGAGATALPAMVFDKRFAVTAVQPTATLQRLMAHGLAAGSETASACWA